jgi:methionyl-tRNA synthetase
VTTAIPYTNADPHIGFALELLYTDILARYNKLLGKDVFFLTGTDEHGQKMFRTAKESGKNVEEFAAEKSAKFQNLADVWNISNNDFIRTTEKRHITRAQKFWQTCFENGDIYKKTYKGLYCVGCEAYKTEKDLINGVCADHPKPPSSVIELEEENYFFKLSKYQEPLEFLFESRPNFVYPQSRFNEMLNILKGGLEDISISRSKEKLPWGIPVPNDESQVMYVWFDALTNYITALEYGEKNDDKFKKFWPGVHVIGKEINRFHSLLWPAMLMSAGLELPKQIAVHGWMTVDGQKMSKSIGNVIDPIELVNKYPLESVRYFLTREIPFDNDGDFSDEKFRERYNADLANGLGNFSSRVLNMVERYCGNIVPRVKEADYSFVNLLKDEIWPNYIECMNNFKFNHALENVWKFITHCDQTISDKKPWEMAKEDKQKELENLLYHLCESLRHIAVLIWPVMPQTSEKILSNLGLESAKELKRGVAELQRWVELTVGNNIQKGDPLFPRLNN